MADSSFTAPRVVRFGRSPAAVSARTVRGAIAACAVGAITLVEPRRLGTRQRAAYRAGVAALSGLLVADTPAGQEPVLDPVRDGLVTAGITFGLMDVMEKLDGSVVDRLRRIGVTRPRLLLAGVGAVCTGVLYALPAAAPQDRWDAIAGVFEPEEVADLPGEVRDLTAALLTSPVDGRDVAGAATLREQLTGARLLLPGYPTPDAQFVVDEPARRVVPHQQTWPVSGEFERRGVRCLVELSVSDGQLGMLSFDAHPLEPQADAALELLSDPAFTLPRPEELTLRLESEQA